MSSALSALYLVGPTAVGKSSVALELAELAGGEIVSVDSMQVYRGMDIGTAKPSSADRARVPHHLLDVVSLRESFDAAQFARMALAAQTAIQSRGRLPIFCGGTGLYFQALWQGLGDAPPADPELRAEFDAKDLPALLEELHRLDPESYERIDRANRRRVVRALEVVRLTGQPYGQQRAAWRLPASSPVGPGHGPVFGLHCPRALLAARIDQRVDQMFSSGLVEEVKRLVPEGLKENLTASQALGYRQVLEHLEGQRSFPDTVARVKQKTRLYAKRQMTWFRHRAPVTWLELEDPRASGQIAQQLAHLCRVAAPQPDVILGGQQHRIESTHLDS